MFLSYMMRSCKRQLVKQQTSISKQKANSSGKPNREAKYHPNHLSMKCEVKGFIY